MKYLVNSTDAYQSLAAVDVIVTQIIGESALVLVSFLDSEDNQLAFFEKRLGGRFWNQGDFNFQRVLGQYGLNEAGFVLPPPETDEDGYYIIRDEEGNIIERLAP